MESGLHEQKRWTPAGVSKAQALISYSASSRQKFEIQQICRHIDYHANPHRTLKGLSPNEYARMTMEPAAESLSDRSEKPGPLSRRHSPIETGQKKSGRSNTRSGSG